MTPRICGCGSEMVGYKMCTSKGKNAFDFGIKRTNNNTFRLLHVEGEGKTILRNDGKYLPTYSV